MFKLIIYVTFAAYKTYLSILHYRNDQARIDQWNVKDLTSIRDIIS